MEQQILKNRVALVTGGGTGLGFGAAQRLIEEGAVVYITGRRQETIDEAAAKLGASAIAVQADAAKKADMQQVAARIAADHGKLDILFANAGGGHPTPLAELTEEQIDLELGSNLKGVILTVQAMAGVMRDGGAIVLNASITADMGLPGFAVYAATKAAVRSLARSWTTDFKERGIRVNSLSPGTVPTEGYNTVQGMSEADVVAFAEKTARGIPARRVGTSREIGDALLFLVSDAASFVRGIDLVVDGGESRVHVIASQ